MVILLQNVSTTESCAILGALMTSDMTSDISQAYIRCSLERLKDYAAQLGTGEMVPVGSVEFVREALAQGAIPEPANMSYPDELNGFLGREVRSCEAGEITKNTKSLGAVFIKPQVTKAFTGFVFDPAMSPDSYSEHDREQYEAFVAMATLSPGTMVWACEPVKWISEWRYYVNDGRVMGSARYNQNDDGDIPAPVPLIPDGAVVAAAAGKLKHRGPCALDFGVLSTGTTALVEVNDFWAIGLHRNQAGDPALGNKEYLEWLVQRWREMVKPAPGLSQRQRGKCKNLPTRRALCL